jgi:hypothetical protein
MFLLASAGMAVAQAPKPSLSVPNTDLYGGFLVTSPDFGPGFSSYLLKGFEGAYSRSLTERLWITADGLYVSGNSFDTREFSATVGPKFFLMTGKLRPYATAQVGFAYLRSHGMYSGDHHPPLAPNALDIEKGMTYRIGGGVEYQVLSRLYWRAQFDVQPQPWGRSKPYYENLGTGVGYRF